MARLKPENEKQVPQYKNIIPNKLKILRQYQKEKDYCVKSRQRKFANWTKNEEAYNGVVQRTLLTRSNLHVPIVFEGVQNMSAKIGAAPELDFETIPEGDENAAEIMKHVVKEDLDECNWDLIYDNSKIEAGIYGRTIYEVIPGNDKQKVELVDTMAYMISPIATNTRDALYQGRQFIYKTYDQLQKESEEMGYDEEELAKVKSQKIAQEMQRDSSSEASARNLRTANMGQDNVTQYGSKVVELTKWWTYIEDEKTEKTDLCQLIVADDLYLLSVKKASEFGLTRPPFVSWGCYTRGITFWCPSVADVYRDPELAISVNINQVIDNNTYRNFGMLFVASSSGLKQSSVVPRPLGVTPVQCSPNENVQSKVWQFTPPEISSALQTINAVKGYADSASGLGFSPTAVSKGKMSVTQQAKMMADLEVKNNVIKRNSTLACQELYQILSDLVSTKMTKPRKVKIFGYKDLTLEDVTKKNFKDVQLVAKAKTSEDSEQNKAIKQKAKIELYQIFKDDPQIPGQIALRRSVAKTFDIDADEIESWFTEEEKTQMIHQSEMPNEKPGPKGEPNIPQSETQPLLSQTGRMAEAQVPPKI